MVTDFVYCDCVYEEKRKGGHSWQKEAEFKGKKRDRQGQKKEGVRTKGLVEKNKKDLLN